MILMSQPVTIHDWTTSTGSQRIKIQFDHYIPAITGEMKELEGAKYEGNNLWTARDTPRNKFSLDVLCKGEYTGASNRYSNNFLGCADTTSKRPLWAHQRNAFKFKVIRRRSIDAGEMGIGKTLSTFEALEYFRSLKDSEGNPSWNGALWWVAPNSGLTALRTQMHKWGAIPLFRVKGTKIINYHNLEKTMEEATIPPQLLVFDEIHALKNPSSRRSQLAQQLTILMEREYGENCVIIGLTGTPAPEDHFDWWNLCEVIRSGYLRESSFNKFKYRLASFGSGERADGGMYPKFLGWKSKEVSLLPKRLDGLVLVTWKKDCLDLPPKIYEERILECSEATKRVARAFTKMYNGLELHARLRQLSDGFQYNVDDEFNKETNYGETPKDSAIVDLLEEYDVPPRRLVVYAYFKASIDKLIKIAIEANWSVWKYDGRGQDTIFAKDEEGIALRKLCPRGIGESTFQEYRSHPQRILFIGSPEAAGQSLTLTPSPAIVYYSNSFKGQYRTQSEDRINRDGADFGIKIIDLIHLPTDKLTVDRIKAKRDVEMITLEEIKGAFGD